MRIRYNALARLDLLGIVEFYEREAGLKTAIDFFAEFEGRLKRISANPRTYPEVRSGVRRCLLSRFPYQIDYEIIDASTVKILIVKHQRRAPDFGLDR